MVAPPGAYETISAIFALVIIWFIFNGGEHKGDD